VGRRLREDGGRASAPGRRGVAGAPRWPHAPAAARRALTSHTTKRFREAFAALPLQVQAQARLAYDLFRRDPFHPSLRFKQIHPTRPIVSARVGLAYRALAVRAGDDVVWFWIGSHADYDKLVARL